MTSVRERAHALRGDGREVEVTGAAGFGADAIEVFGDINGHAAARRRSGSSCSC